MAIEKAEGKVAAEEAATVNKAAATAKETTTATATDRAANKASMAGVRWTTATEAAAETVVAEGPLAEKATTEKAIVKEAAAEKAAAEGASNNTERYGEVMRIFKATKALDKDAGGRKLLDEMWRLHGEDGEEWPEIGDWRND